MSNTDKFQVVRLGDTSSHNGSMITATSKIKLNQITGCVDQDLHSCPYHGVTQVTGTGKIKSNHKRSILVTDVAGCGAVLTTGSPNITSIKDI